MQIENNPKKIKTKGFDFMGPLEINALYHLTNNNERITHNGVNTS